MTLRQILGACILGLIGWGILYFAAIGVKFYWYTEVKGYVLTMPAGGYGEVGESRKQSLTIIGENMKEAVECDFDPPLKYVNLINHWYDTNEEMYSDYILLADKADKMEIWGWSSCIWQPEDSWAACDLYLVKPQFVHADMYVDTIGHEVLHAACRDFHE